MKAHHIAAIAMLVILTGAGYVITVWQQATIPHEEAHGEETVHGGEEDVHTAGNDNNANQDHGTETTDHGEDNNNSNVATSVSGTGNTTETASNEGSETGDHGGENADGTTEAANTETGTETASTETTNNTQETETTSTTSASETNSTATSSTNTAAPSALTEAEIDMTMTVEDDNIVIAFKASEDLDLRGWRLGDAIGVAGLTDHLYYFGDVQLAAGDTLEVHSACGSDRDLSRYWCVSQSRTLANSMAKGIFFVDDKGEVAVSCTPVDAESAPIRYECL